MRGIVALALKQRVLVNLAFVLFMGVGVAVYLRLPVDSYPEVNLDEAWITTYWDGAGAEEVERLVTKKIEDEIDDIPGVDRIVSTSQSNMSFIDVKFDESLDEQTLETSFNDLRAALDRVVELPDEAEQPVLQRLTTNEIYPLFQVVVSARDPRLPEIVLRETATELRAVLTELPGLQRARYNGYRDRELHVLVDRLEARKYGVGLTEVVSALSRTNRPHPAGTVSSKASGVSSTGGPKLDRGDEARVTFDDEYREPLALERAVVRTVPGRSPLRVSDVARVQVGFEKAETIIRMNGDRAIVLNVSKNPDGDTLRMRDLCAESIEEFRAVAPEGIDFNIVADQSEIVRSRFNVLLENLLLGVIFVSIILFFSLGLRNALIALVGLPFSYVCCFLLFPALDISINNLTLFGLVLVGGMLVDDAIIVIENIYRRVENGEPMREAVFKGTCEVAWPVTNACLTTVAAMLPLLLQGGVVGKFFSYMPKVVILALFFSVIQCVTVLPVHYLEFGHRLKSGTHGWLQRARVGVFAAASTVYERMLAFVLRFRLAFLSVLGGISLLLVGLVMQIPEDPWISDFNAVFVTIKCDPSYGVERTAEATQLVEEELDRLLEDDLLKNYYSVSGSSLTTDGVFLRGSNLAFFLVSLVDRPEVVENPEAVINRLRAALHKRTRESKKHRILSWEIFTPHDGPPLGKPVAVRVECNDYVKAKRLAEEIKTELRRMDGVTDIVDNLDLGPRELRFDTDPDRAPALGFFPRDVAMALRCANDGLLVGSYKDHALDEDVDIRVLYDEKDRAAPEDLLLADVQGSSTAMVPIGEISDVDVSRSSSSFYHYNTRRTVLVTANVDGVVATGPAVNRRLERIFSDVAVRHSDVRLVFGGEFEENARSMAEQKRSFWIALVLIYVLLAGQFRSYTQPLIVMAVVPFGALGVLLGLWMRSQPFTIPAFIAMIGLAGVVVNDSLMLVEFINLRRREGFGRWEAILTAARQRFRPVLLAAGTTIFNLLPLAFGLGGASRVWTPFAVSVVFGMAVASLMTLFMVPVLYSLVVKK